MNTCMTYTCLNVLSSSYSILNECYNVATPHLWGTLKNDAIVCLLHAKGQDMGTRASTFIKRLALVLYSNTLDTTTGDIIL